MGENRRIRCFDVARGLGIILVVIGHFGISALNKFIYSFHMPLFFFCSGYFIARGGSIRDNMAKKARQLLVPYYFTSLCVVIGSILLGFLFGDSPLDALNAGKKWTISLLYASGSLEPFGIRRIGAIWFLWALFIGQLVVRMALLRKRPALFVIAVGMIGMASGSAIWLPLSIQPALSSVLFIYCGFSFKQHGLIEREKHCRWFLLALILWGVCIAFCDTNMARNYYSHYLLNVVGAICGIYVLLKGIRFIEKHCYARVLNALAYLGRYSLVLLCFHLIELDLIKWSWVYDVLCNAGLSMGLIYALCFGIKMIYMLSALAMVNRLGFLRHIFSMERN